MQRQHASLLRNLRDEAAEVCEHRCICDVSATNPSTLCSLDTVINPIAIGGRSALKLDALYDYKKGVVFVSSPIGRYSKGTNPAGTETPFGTTQLTAADKISVMTSEVDVCLHLTKSRTPKPMCSCS